HRTATRLSGWRIWNGMFRLRRKTRGNDGALTPWLAHRDGLLSPPWLALSVMSGSLRHGWLSPSWLALSVMAGSLRHSRACPGHPPPVGGTAAEAVQPPVRGWPEHALPHAQIRG